ncbi:MAG TPA: divergent polysaccharide deacetylase family protein [Xanthobacteraceae bacterium]|jgi:hypothetical protein|nr:divergent polysaccharide deacetylase family protein [Xanthobacteraceae bacterium]
MLPIAIPQAIAGTLALCLAIFGLWVLLVDDPLGGEPIAVIATNSRESAAAPRKGEAGEKPLMPAKSADMASAKTGHLEKAPTPIDEKKGDAKAGDAKTVTIIDGMSGKRQEVPLTAAERTPGFLDQRVTENSRHGPIPKVGDDGIRPADVFAQPVKTATGKTEGPRIALVIGGLGVSAIGISETLAKLGPAVTLAFAPYGTDLQRWVTRARGEGHEILLQIPMEPFDYPDNDPGPQTLLTTLAPDQNVDRLHWSMSRFQGYVGIGNYMGARFTATEAAIVPVLRDTAKRGLIYFDDSTSPRSVAGQIAGANTMAFAKADVVLDVVANAVDIDAALEKLETIARERGTAVGIASALPVSIERISNWIKTLESRGVSLIPISAVAAKPKSS